MICLTEMKNKRKPEAKMIIRRMNDSCRRVELLRACYPILSLVDETTELPICHSIWKRHETSVHLNPHDQPFATFYSMFDLCENSTLFSSPLLRCDEFPLFFLLFLFLRVFHRFHSVVSKKFCENQTKRNLLQWISERSGRERERGDGREKRHRKSQSIMNY